MNDLWRLVGKTPFYLHRQNRNTEMARLIGEYECRIDGKGRLIIPTRLKRQLPPEAQEKLVINRSLDKCLVLFTKADWEKESERLDGLNMFNAQHRQFIRLYHNGANEIAVDTSDRILIPKNLKEYAEINTDVVLFAYGNRIEIWSEKVYQQELSTNPEAFAGLAEQVLGNKTSNEPHRPDSA